MKRHGQLNEYYIVGGTDLGQTVERWKNWNTIKDRFKLLIVPRAGMEETGEDLQIIASSTAIRKRLKERGGAVPFIPPGVQRYITARGLCSE